MRNDYYKKGDWNGICDSCKGKFKFQSQMVYQSIPEMPGFWVCKRCLDEHNPQFDLRGIADNPSIPYARPLTNVPTNLIEVSGHELPPIP